MKLWDVEASGRYTAKAKVSAPTGDEAIRAVQERIAQTVAAHASVSLIDVRAKIKESSTWTAQEAQPGIVMLEWDLNHLQHAKS